MDRNEQIQTPDFEKPMFTKEDSLGGERDDIGVWDLHIEIYGMITKKDML